MTRRLPPAVEGELARSFSVQLNPEDRQLTSPELRAALDGADGLLCTLTDRLDASVLAGGHRARILASFGVGYNHIDLDAASRAGLLVTNTPGVLTECTADLTLALLLMVMRRLGEGERLVRAGRWPGWSPTHHLGRRLSGKTLGIVGYGRIGTAVARRARHGFGMRILVHSRSRPAADQLALVDAEFVDRLESLLPRVDALSLHAPATTDTHRLIDRNRLALLPPHAVLVNTARGELVDEPALIEALGSGRLAGAGLDVYAGEPRVAAGLLALENVVLLPHLGSATEETRTAMGMRAVENLRAFFRGERPPDLVNNAAISAG